MISFPRPVPFVLGAALTALLGTAAVVPAAASQSPWYSDQVYNPLDNNDYTIYNNAWGDPNYQYGSSSVTYNGSGGGVDWTANWSWPNGSNSWVCGYPECALTVNWGYYYSISSIKTAPSKWTYSLSLNGSETNAYDVAYDIYVKDSDSGTPSNTEIMIWTDWTGTGPIGSVYQSNLSFAGRTWNLYYGLNGSMPVWSYVLQGSPMTTVNMDLNPFFQHLAGLRSSGANVFDGNGQLTTIDYGIEIHKGAGSLTTTHTQTTFTTG